MMSETNHGVRPEEVIFEWRLAGRSSAVVDALMFK